MPKPVKSIKLTPGKQKQIVSAIDLLGAHYGDVLRSWAELTPRQRGEVLAHSPLLARLVELVRPAVEIEHGT